MKLRYQVCDFTVPLPNGNRMIEDSMRRIIESDSFKKRLKGHELIGSISHKFRWDEDKRVKEGAVGLPQSDLLLLNNEAANVVENIWIEDHKLIADIQVLQSTELGKRIKNLIEVDGIYPDISMVVYQDDKNDGTTEFNDFLGIDFTQLPALETELLATYSKMKSNPKDNYMDFMLGSVTGNSDGASRLSCNSKFIGKDLESSELATNSAIESTPNVNTEMETYSLKDYIKVRSRKPMQALALILADTRSYIKSNGVDKLRANKTWVLDYTFNYINTMIIKLISDPSVKTLNFTMVFGLNKYCDTAVIVEFQKVCNLVMRQKRNTGYIDKMMQAKLSLASGKLDLELMKYILDGIDSEKQKIFIGGSNE